MLKEKLLYKLYYVNKLSMWDIAKTLSVTPATVIYWMDRYNLKRRSRSDCAYVKQNPNGDPFKIKKRLSNREKALLICGLMLYCGEGNRNNNHSIQLANLDYRILKLFAQFLRKVCGVDKNKITLYVQLYRKFNRNKARDYWSGVLTIPKSQIRIYTHTDKRSKIEQLRSKFGIARIQVHNYKLKNWLDRQSDYYLDVFNK